MMQLQDLKDVQIFQKVSNRANCTKEWRKNSLGISLKTSSHRNGIIYTEAGNCLNMSK